MVRWEPGARERLRAAALELYVARGFDNTTAAEIAQSVGLTERTFFRHFTDKREVLFDGQSQLEGLFVDAVAASPPNTSVIDTVAHALNMASAFFPDDERSTARQRSEVIVANPALQERELLKMAWLSRKIAAALQVRGVSEPEATLAAESGVTVFGVAFRLWIASGENRTFGDIQQGMLRKLRILISKGG